MFQKALFKGQIKEEMYKRIQEEGFNPLLISNEPGYVYHKHKHVETKLLACVAGSMEVTVDNVLYLFEPGDKLLIPGNTFHSAIVGKSGCTFYWSEKVI